MSTHFRIGSYANWICSLIIVQAKKLGLNVMTVNAVRMFAFMMGSDNIFIYFIYTYISYKYRAFKAFIISLRMLQLTQ